MNVTSRMPQKFLISSFFYPQSHTTRRRCQSLFHATEAAFRNVLSMVQKSWYDVGRRTPHETDVAVLFDRELKCRHLTGTHDITLKTIIALF
jgi:hypothetical protein